MKFTKPRLEPPLLAFLIGLIAWVATTAYLKRPFVGDWVDDGQYLVSARSICDLGGYRLPSRPGNPVATKYPIGTSTVAAVAMALLPGGASTGHDWLAGRIVVVCAGVALAVACRRFLQLSGLAGWPACLLALAVVWHPQMMHLTATLMSDVPFAAVSTVLLVRWVGRPRSGGEPDWVWAADGLLAGAGWLIRGNGITLVVAALVGASLRGPSWARATAAVLAGVACLWLPAAIHVRAMSGPRDTGGYATEQVAAYRAADHFWSLPAANLSRIPGEMATAVCSPMAWTTPVVAASARWPALRWAVGAATLGLIAVGSWRLIRRDAWPPPVWVHASLTLVVFIVWHYPFNLRFALPLIPLIFAGCAMGVEALTRRGAGATLFAAGSLTASVLVVAGIALRSHAHSGVMGGGRTSSTTDLFEAISSLTPSDAAIFCRVPELIYLNTGRVAAPLRDDADLYVMKPLSWEGLRGWTRLVGDRPLYILETDSMVEGDGGNVAALCRDGRCDRTPIAVGSAGRLWRVERRDDPQQ